MHGRAGKMMQRYGGKCGVQSIAGAVNQPKEGTCCAQPIDNSVAMKPKMAAVNKIKGAVTGPK